MLPPPIYFSVKTVFFVVFFAFSVPCFSEDFRWYDGFFVEGAFHQYFAPDLLYDYVKTSPGFRAAVGYEYQRFHLAVESGYAYIEGTNPLVLDVKLIPLSLKFGYEYPIIFGFGVQGDLLAGYFFSKINRYETAMDILLGNLQEDNERNLFAGARLYATWSTKGKFLKIYAGGGADVIIENDGPVPLTLVEVGVHIHPLMLIPRKKPQTQIVYEEPQPTVYEETTPEIFEEIEEQVFEEPEVYEETEIEIFEEPEPEPEPEPVRLLWLVLFSADKTTPDAEGLATLDLAASAIIGAEGEYTLVLKGYAAPLVNAAGQDRVSRDRALFCKKYLMEKYGIPEERITVEWHGAKKNPENVNDRPYSQRRSVEIIFEGFMPQQKNALDEDRQETQEIQELQNIQETEEQGEEE